MRIVIDMQGAQTESRYRGIGRYTMSFAKAMARNRGEHEIILALNGLFPDSVELIRAEFEDILHQDNIRLWSAPGPVMERVGGNEQRRKVAEIMREDFLASLRPDIIHVCSLFEGFVDDAVTSIALHDKETPVSVILHDLIPLTNPDHFLKPNPAYTNYYHRKIGELKKAGLFLANSRHTAKEGVAELNLDPRSVVPIFAAVDESFRRISLTASEKKDLLSRCGIMRDFVFYTGGCDDHKNLFRLIEAFSLLPSDTRAKHQLVFSGHMPEGNIRQLRSKAEEVGLGHDELVFVGYVSDADLIKLYNLCSLFVFPSWQEGFGMPPLEAMACGAPVLTGNRTSLPEVVGWSKATFDPFDSEAIANKISQALNDRRFREELISRGGKHAQSFSWDLSAQKAIGAMCEFLQAKAPKKRANGSESRLIDSVIKAQAEATAQDLANLSCHLAANRQAGVERQLFLDVSELCQRDAGTGVQRVVRNHLKNLLASPPAGFRVEPVYATRDEGYRYARDFARAFMGSPTVSGPDEPIEWQRGDIFFALDMQHHVQLQHRGFFRLLRAEGVTVKFLVHDLLPIQLADHFKDSDAKDLHEQWLSMVADSDGGICVSQATADALCAWIKTHQIKASSNFTTEIVYSGADFSPAASSEPLNPDAQTLLEKLRGNLTFLCVSTIEPRKRQQQIIEAFEILWAAGHDVNLVFVGREGWKVDDLARKLREHPEAGRRFFWLEGISDEYLDQVYPAADCTIAASLNEGFGLSLIESAIKGVDLIARDIPVFREVAGDSAYYFTGDTAEELATAVNDWIKLKNAGSAPCAENLRYLTWEESTGQLKEKLVKPNYPRRQLLVDVSELVQKDAGSGIQRVVRNILREWLKTPPPGYRVEPVYARPNEPYRYARDFTARFTQSEPSPVHDSPIEYAPGDVFLGLDFQPQVVMSHEKTYQLLRMAGVRVVFLVYDLLSIRMPEYFLPGNKEGFESWLKVVAQADGAVCISKSVADDLRLWINESAQSVNSRRRFSVDWFHLGADMDSRGHHSAAPKLDRDILQSIQAAPSFLCVGTMEPRKGITQALDAFEILWKQGIEANLVLVGKAGWMVDELIERINSHPELDRRLFWLQGISDQGLEDVYKACCCLLAPSFGEGFGLPLIEAAQRGLPILARDLSVFREVAGSAANYFVANSPGELSESIKHWLNLYARNVHMASSSMRRMSWSSSAHTLVTLLLPKV